MKIVYLLMALVGGLAVGVQAVVNGGLGKKVGSMEASFISFFIGTTVLFSSFYSSGKAIYWRFQKFLKVNCLVVFLEHFMYLSLS